MPPALLLSQTACKKEAHHAKADGLKFTFLSGDRDRRPRSREKNLCEGSCVLAGKGCQNFVTWCQVCIDIACANQRFELLSAGKGQNDLGKGTVIDGLDHCGVKAIILIAMIFFELDAFRTNAEGGWITVVVRIDCS